MELGVGLGEVQHTICYNSINDRRRYWDGVTREPTGILGLMGPDMALPLPSVNQKLLRDGCERDEWRGDASIAANICDPPCQNETLLAGAYNDGSGYLPSCSGNKKQLSPYFPSCSINKK